MKGTHRRRMLVVAAAAALAVLIAPADALANHGERYAELQERIAQTRSKIRAVRAKEKKILSQIATSDQRRMSLERSLAALTDQLVLATRRLEVLQLQQEQAEAELQAKTFELGATEQELEE